MIKQARSAFFILLAHANIILLAHTIIPHHYHKNEIHLDNFQCQTHSEDYEHNPTDHHHEHNGESNAEYCISNQEFTARSNQARLQHTCLNFANNRVNYGQFESNHTCKELINFLPICLYSANRPLISLSYYHYYSNGLGLRAPPIV